MIDPNESAIFGSLNDLTALRTLTSHESTRAKNAEAYADFQMMMADSIKETINLWWTRQLSHGNCEGDSLLNKPTTSTPIPERALRNQQQRIGLFVP
jgi:hypothetical protein